MSRADLCGGNSAHEGRGESASCARETTFSLELANAKIGVYLQPFLSQYLHLPRGPVAQLIERVVRNDEVVGLIPIRSTISRRVIVSSCPRWPTEMSFREGSAGHTLDGDGSLRRERR